MNDYEELTVSEIDDLLDAENLPKSGLKADKVQRLIDADEKFPLETPNEAGRDKPEVIPSTEEIAVSPVYDDFIEKRLWAGVKTVYVCRNCGRQEDREDDMILHALKHVPENLREQFMEFLLEKEGN